MEGTLLGVIMNLVDLVNKQHLNEKTAKFPRFKTGDTVAVYVQVKDEGGKIRSQLFQGVCIAINKRNLMNGLCEMMLWVEVLFVGHDRSRLGIWRYFQLTELGLQWQVCGTSTKLKQKRK